MNVLTAAHMMGVSEDEALSYALNCDAVVDFGPVLAMRSGNVVHLAVSIAGLGGRKVLRICSEILDDWFNAVPQLRAPIRHGNKRALKIALALGFEIYASTDTHVWLKRDKESCNGQ